MTKRDVRKKILIMGAAGRDFHNFNVLLRGDPSSEVLAFTATQIPFIEERTYPAELAGPLYPDGIPIYSESRLAGLIGELNIDEVIFSYSDISYTELMGKASLVNAAGAAFTLPDPRRTMLASTKPVISVCAVRTGCGKSAITRYIAGVLREAGLRAVAVRHPMPYGELNRDRAVQRFATLEDMTTQRCTIEEMEEYEPLVKAGVVVFAGIDYEAILREAEKEADIIIWDGGNNDTPFYRPDLSITVADPLRPGDERAYYPGETNVRLAHCVIINKARAADDNSIKAVEESVRALNPGAALIRTDLALHTSGGLEAGTNVLAIEDGPTLTHGGMAYGAGIAACRLHGWVPVDPRPYAVGSIKDTFSKYPAIKDLLPAVGYSPTQVKDLEKTINATPADAVVVATPIDLGRIIKINKPSVRVSYSIDDYESGALKGLVEKFISRKAQGRG